MIGECVKSSTKNTKQGSFESYSFPLRPERKGNESITLRMDPNIAMRTKHSAVSHDGTRHR